MSENPKEVRPRITPALEAFLGLKDVDLFMSVIAGENEAPGEVATGDIFGVSALLDRIEPGDLVLDYDAFEEKSIIRRLGSLDFQDGPGRGKVLCEVDFDPGVDTLGEPLKQSGRWHIVGRVEVTIRKSERLQSIEAAA
ncbi:MAG: hypothetical protein JNK51_09305 [Blastocatellia bacterium]|nr:hypothetical protein [Chloracidobacterium sp.]MBL8185110.1 hypothetical protein [Blastocatellia bacterium]